MGKSRFNEAQIIAVLREQEAGIPAADVCRRHGVSEQTFYRWKAKYGGMQVSDAQRLKTLEDENRRLKKLLAESMLDVAALKDILGKIDHARDVQRGRASPDGRARPLKRRACGLIDVDPKTVRRTRKPGDEVVQARLRHLAAVGRRFGYRRLGVLLQREGLAMNKKKSNRSFKPRP